MRASPAFHVRIARFGAWRAAVGTLIIVAFGVQAAWLAGRAEEAPVALSVALSALDLAVMAAAASALRMVPVDLRWDTQRWLLDRHAGFTEPAPGNLTIALDLGVWMLLRFDHDPPPRGRRRTTWLPVQRRGLETHWHALRCAVYCARPAPGTDAGPNLHAGPESQE